MDKVDLADKFSLLKDYWSPRIVGELNDAYIKLPKLKGNSYDGPAGTRAEVIHDTLICSRPLSL